VVTQLKPCVSQVSSAAPLIAEFRGSPIVQHHFQRTGSLSHVDAECQIPDAQIPIAIIHLFEMQTSGILLRIRRTLFALVVIEKNHQLIEDSAVLEHLEDRRLNHRVRQYRGDRDLSAGVSNVTQSCDNLHT
jgi:hypothetical protein